MKYIHPDLDTIIIAVISMFTIMIIMQSSHKMATMTKLSGKISIIK